jgi:two-component system, OmpR family, response regulator RegX3
VVTQGRPTVLVVEDEASYVEALTIGLTREGFNVEVAVDGADALMKFEDVQPDLVLLDVMLPKMSGIDVCRLMRKRSQVPIIMVTAKGAEIDTVVGLEVGADDYVTKPYRMRELVARMRAVMRRQGTGAPQPAEVSAGSITVGDLSLDPDEHRASADARRAHRPRVGQRLRGRHQDARRAREAVARQGGDRSGEPDSHHHHSWVGLQVRTSEGLTFRAPTMPL